MSRFLKLRLDISHLMLFANQVLLAENLPNSFIIEGALVTLSDVLHYPSVLLLSLRA